jgi:hypothetical protein
MIRLWSHIQARPIRLWNFEGSSVCPLVCHSHRDTSFKFLKPVLTSFVKRSLAFRRRVITQQHLRGLQSPISSSEKAYTLRGFRGPWCAPVAGYRHWKYVGNPWTGPNDLQHLIGRRLNWSNELTQASSKYFPDPLVRNPHLIRISVEIDLLLRSKCSFRGSGRRRDDLRRR